MSIRVLRWTTAELAQSHLAPPCGAMINNGSTQKRTFETEPTTPVVEEAASSSYMEALSLTPPTLVSSSMPRLLSEVEEWGDEDQDDISNEELRNSRRFSPRPTLPPIDEKRTSNRPGSFLPEIQIEDDYDSDGGLWL